MEPSQAKVLVHAQVDEWLHLFNDDMTPKEGAIIPAKVLALLAKFENQTPNTDESTAYPFAVDSSLFQFSPHSGDTIADVWFERGIAWAFGFNFTEASRCFQKSLSIAGDHFALGHYGLALCHGPYYNRHGARYLKDGLNPTASTFNVFTAVAHAEAASQRASTNPTDPVHAALIEALLVRFRAFASTPPPPPQAPTPTQAKALAQELKESFDVAENKYADQLRIVLTQTPNNPNVAAFLAAALMNLAPWKLWLPTDATPRTQRTPASNTLEIERVLRHALSVAPTHPGLAHLWVHAMEMAPDATQSLPQAQLLAQAGAAKTSEIGHLSHMAAHIFMQVGDYQAAIETSLHAVAADRKMIDTGMCDIGIYSGAVHNLHELVFSCMWAGNLELGRQALVQLENTAKESGVERLPTRLEPFGLTKYHFLIRFGL